MTIQAQIAAAQQRIIAFALRVAHRIISAYEPQPDALPERRFRVVLTLLTDESGTVARKAYEAALPALTSGQMLQFIDADVVRSQVLGAASVMP